MKCDFVGQAYSGRSISIDGQELVNFFVEQNQANSKAPYSLIPTPGMKLLASFPGATGGCRGLFVTGGERLLFVLGNQLWEYSIANNGNETKRVLGTLRTAAGRISIAEVITGSGSIVGIVDGQYGYYLITESNTFGEFGGDYHAGTSITSIAGYFLQNTNEDWYGGTRFIRSGQYNDATKWGTDIDPAAVDTYFTAEVSPDPIRSIQNVNGEIWLVGSKSIEVWYFTGNTDLLFARVNAGSINIGSAGGNCVTVINNQIAWLGSGMPGSGSVWLASGYIPQKISSDAIEYIIGKMDDISDCIAFSYMQEGNTFLVFSFPTGNRTLCYDISTGLWHERGSFDVLTGLNNRHRVTSAVLWRQKIVVSDADSPYLYTWDLNVYTDAGEIIRRVRTAAHLHDDRKRVLYRSFEIDMERGIGLLPLSRSLETGQVDRVGSDPQVMLQWSDDGGFTWSSEYWVSAGRTGNRFARVRWNRLGQSRDRIFRATFSDPVKFIVIDARMDAELALN